MLFLNPFKMFPSIQNGSRFKPVGHSVQYKNQINRLIRMTRKKQNRKHGTLIIVLGLFLGSKAEL